MLRLSARAIATGVQDATRPQSRLSDEPPADSEVDAFERVIRLFVRAIAAGVQDTARPHPRLSDEPLPADSEVDWDRAFEFACDRRETERNRLERIESKIAPIIAATLAALGLFVDKAASPLDLAIAAFLLVPLAMLLLAFRTTDYQDVPNLDVLVQTYAWYPKTYIRSLVLGAAEAISKNTPIIDRKARDLNRAMAVLYVTVVVILIWRAGEAIYHERHFENTPGATVSAKPTTAASDTGIRTNPPQEGGRNSAKPTPEGLKTDNAFGRRAGPLPSPIHATRG